MFNISTVDLNSLWQFAPRGTSDHLRGARLVFRPSPPKDSTHGASGAATRESAAPVPFCGAGLSGLERGGSETYMRELDAAITGGNVGFLMTNREEVTNTATFPSWIRTTRPAARKQIVWMLPCFEGQSITISR
jgi:hypothetical protein